MQNLGAMVQAGAVDDESARDLAALQGTWTLVSSEVNGEDTSDQAAEGDGLSVAEANYVVTSDGRKTRYKLRLEPTTDPKALELTVADGPAEGQILKGIYKLDDNRFTICYGLTPRDPRPVEFATGAESGSTLIVWRRTAPEAQGPGSPEAVTATV